MSARRLAGVTFQIEYKDCEVLEIGTVIRIVRQAHGLKLTELAGAAQISIPFLSLIEKGRKQPSLDVLRRIAAALDVPSEVLVLLAFPASGSLESRDGQTTRLAECIRRLSEAEANLQSLLGADANNDAE